MTSPSEVRTRGGRSGWSERKASLRRCDELLIDVAAAHDTLQLGKPEEEDVVLVAQHVR